MIQSSLTSLVEVGIALNLVFSIPASVRDLISNFVQHSSKARKERCTILLTEIDANTDGYKERVLSLVDKWDSAYRRYTNNIKIISITLSTIIAFSLFYFLTEIAVQPDKIISDDWAYRTAFLNLPPIVGQKTGEIRQFPVLFLCDFLRKKSLC
jgi:hypothetical protein